MIIIISYRLEDCTSFYRHLRKRFSRGKRVDDKILLSKKRQSGEIAAIYHETFTTFSGLPRLSGGER